MFLIITIVITILLTTTTQTSLIVVIGGGCDDVVTVFVHEEEDEDKKAVDFADDVVVSFLLLLSHCVADCLLYQPSTSEVGDLMGAFVMVMRAHPRDADVAEVKEAMGKRRERRRARSATEWRKTTPNVGLKRERWVVEEKRERVGGERERDCEEGIGGEEGE